MPESEHRPLWAPWRLCYVTKPRNTGGCFLCDIAAHPEDDLANHVIFRSRTCFVVLNAFPYTSGHAMVVPYRHLPGILELDQEERLELMNLEAKLQQAVSRAMKPQGFNFGFNLGEAAGAGLAPHLHAHLVPRWNGDNNFMPVLADIHVIPQALDESARVIRQAWTELFPEA